MRNILITGGSSGIGLAIAQRLAQNNNVTILGRDDKKLAATGLKYEVGDVTNYSDMQKAIKRIDPCCIIANAGFAPSSPFEKINTDDFNSVINTNLSGVFNTFHAAFPAIKHKKNARLIAIASSAAVKGYAYVSHYAAAKHGVLGLVRSLALEYAAFDLTVNAICPSFTNTPLIEESLQMLMKKRGFSRDESIQLLAQFNPQKRLIDTNEIAEMVAFLLKPEAKSITGQALNINGGEV